MNTYKNKATGATVEGAQWDGRVVTAEAWIQRYGFEYEAHTHRVVVPVADGHKRVANKDDVVWREPGEEVWNVTPWIEFFEAHEQVESKKGKSGA